jgi:outer membrane protein
LAINQILFNGSYIVGLQASNAYKDLTVKNTNQTKEQLIANVSKAYYNVLINTERLDLFNSNISRLDTLYRNTVEMNQNGFAEKIDVDRLKVNLNNIKTERDNFINLNELAMQLLKFQMNYPQAQPLAIGGSINEELAKPLEELSADWDYKQRPDYQRLLANKKMQELNLKNKYAEALPSIGAFANLGYSTQSPDFGGIFKTNSTFKEQPAVGPDSWYKYSTVGVRLSWQIFTGSQRYFQIQQQKIELAKIDNNFEQVQQSIDLEVRQAQINLQNAQRKLEVQRENSELAKNIFSITQTKYQEGVGSNLEVVEADNSLKEAQNNYYNALYEAIIAKIDLQKAFGTLYK